LSLISSAQYHDDGEKDLGPTIATLSLGGDAIMTMRLKGRYWKFPKGMTLDTYDPLAPVFPGSQLYKERMEVNDYFRAGDMQAFGIAKAELFRKLKKNNNAKNASPVLTMKLKMGDMIVMHGAEMQQYFEHSVVPEGKLRFALTCRYIKPEQISENEHWKGKFNIDPKDLYTGDVDLTADDGDFSFLDNGEPEINTDLVPGTAAVGDVLDDDFVMVNAPAATSQDVEESRVDVSITPNLGDNENDPVLTLTASPTPSPN